jgi:23S rRNA (pseudouridine1915-N3)-methyltransferase
VAGGEGDRNSGRVKVFLYYSGNAKDPHANALAADYIKRANHYASASMTEVRPDKADLWARHPTAKKILFDPAGRSLDSNRFADLFAKAEMLGHDLVFVIGGHDGLPDAWRSRADLLVSLSAMTMPHELARAVVAEQIYRAFTILRGHPYPR